MNNEYQKNLIYSPSLMIKNNKDIFFIEMVKIRERLIQKYCKKNFYTLDLCCGSGVYIQNLLKITKNIIAIDNTQRYIKHVKNEYPNIKVIMTDSSNLEKINNNYIDMIICFSSLYYIQNLKDTLKEINRVMKKNGISILEFGNKFSLNALISKKFEKKNNWAKSYPINYKLMKKLIKESGFKIIEVRHFQITSYYGSIKKYSILNFISHSIWQKIFCFKFFGLMLDEWISSILPFISFRKIYILTK